MQPDSRLAIDSQCLILNDRLSQESRIEWRIKSYNRLSFHFWINNAVVHDGWICLRLTENSPKSRWDNRQRTLRHNTEITSSNQQKSTVSINLLCENDSLKGLPATLGDIRFEVLLVILERLEGCRTLGVIDKLWEPPNPSFKLLSISLYCFCKDKQTLRRPRKPSSLLNKTSLFPFLFPFCLVWCAVWLKDESISSWTLLQSLSSSCTVVLDLM